nr:hypothetical protein [Endozoicomonas sp.]
MDTEKTLDIISETRSLNTLHSLCEFLSDKWVYFYVMDDGSFVNAVGVPEIVNPGGDPINMPTVYQNDLNHAVIYLNKSTALSGLKPEYRLGQMKGKKAFAMFIKAPSVTGIIFQGRETWTAFHISCLSEFLAVEA